MASQVDYIPPVGGANGLAGRAPGDADLIASELEAIAAVRPHLKELAEAAAGGGATVDPDRHYLIGLALSGGGIRSATFSLGVLQKLAGAGILRHVDYLSTVSGGGYVGSALTWWLRPDRQTQSAYDTGANFPFGTEDPAKPHDKERPPLDYLRANGRYLTPSHAITIWSGIAVVLRAIILNLLVWVPVVAGLVLALHLLSRLPFINGLPHLVSMVSPDTLPRLTEAVGAAGSISAAELFPATFLLLLVLAVVLLGVFVLSCINHSLLSWMGRPETLRTPGMKADRSRSFTGLRLGSTPRWLIAGAIGVVGLAVIGATVVSLQDAAEPLFAHNVPESAQPGALLASGPYAVVLALLGGVLLYVFGKGHRWDWSQFKGFWLVYATYVSFFALDLVLVLLAQLRGIEPATAARLSAALQFIAGLGLIALVNFWMATGIRWVLRSKDVSLEYGGRRMFEIVFGLILILASVFAVVGTLPLVSAYIDHGLGGLGGLISVLSGAVSVAIGQLRASTKGGDTRLTKVLIGAGALLLVYGVLLLGYRFAVVYIESEPEGRALLAGIFLVALITGWFVNVNYIGLHRFYRDRLMEAFLPDDETAASGENDAARGANELGLQACWDTSRQRDVPYHIINANAVLSNSRQRTYRLRGGDNFILSPLFFGSNSMGWRSAGTYADGDMSLPSALATSGAAANPRGGVGGKGITRNKFVSIVMSLLSVRLGYWTHHPRLESGRRMRFLDRRPNHFFPGGYYLLPAMGYAEGSNWIELSDGGHFENLAVYELIRRRCGLIIVCDGGQDIECSYSDFVTAIQRVGQDFGASIRFNMEVEVEGKFEKSDPAKLIGRNEHGEFPKKAAYSDKGYFVATIDYGDARGRPPWPRTGTLIYLKSALIRALDIRAKGYKGAHEDFPNESTADQFFDEEQFEAYREVGYRIAAQMIDDLGLETLIGGGRPPLSKLRGNDRFREMGQQ